MVRRRMIDQRTLSHGAASTEPAAGGVSGSTMKCRAQRRDAAVSCPLATHCTSGASVLDDAEATALSRSRLRLDDDLDVLSEPGQETHQPFAREVCQSTTQQG